MKKIKATGSMFRRLILAGEGITQKEISQITKIAPCRVSAEIGSNIGGMLGNKKRLRIYEYYASRAQQPISVKDFWCGLKILREVK